MRRAAFTPMRMLKGGESVANDSACVHHMNVGRAGGGGLDGYLLCEVVELLFCRWQPMPVFERSIPCGGGHSRRGFCGHWPGSAHQLTIHAAHPLSAFLNPFSNHKGMAVRLEPVNSCVMFLSRLGFSVLFTCCFCIYFLKAAEAFAHHSPLFSTPYPRSKFFVFLSQIVSPVWRGRGLLGVGSG